MGIGPGIDYVTWRKIKNWIPPTSNLHVGTGFNNCWANVCEIAVFLVSQRPMVHARTLNVQRTNAKPKRKKEENRADQHREISRIQKSASNQLQYSWEHKNFTIRRLSFRAHPSKLTFAVHGTKCVIWATTST